MVGDRMPRLGYVFPDGSRMNVKREVVGLTDDEAWSLCYMGQTMEGMLLRTRAHTEFFKLKGELMLKPIEGHA